MTGRFAFPHRTSRSCRGFSLALAACLGVVRPAHAQSVVDSAAVFSTVVDAMLKADSLEAPRGWYTSTQTLVSADKPRVWVTIGTMPTGACTAPSILRLRAHRWYFNGWAMDSTRAAAERARPLPPNAWGAPFPAELSLHLTFTGDSARVDEYFAMNDCAQHPGLEGAFVTTHRLAREPSGWRLVDSNLIGVSDGLCK